MPADRQNSSGYRALATKTAMLAAFAAALLLPTGPASAQGVFDSLFGRRPASPANAYADPSPSFNPFNLFGSRPEAQRPPEMGVGGAFCVRTCDGRFFPVQQHAGLTPAQACSSFCPAAQTKIYNGSSIEQSVGPDGRRYTDLATAFAYREKIVPGCTCNGKDAFGLVTTPVDEDPTLRPGDIVATNNGLMAYNGNIGSARKQTASYTPISSYSGLSGDLRRKLTETKVAPALESPAKPPQAPPSEATSATRSAKKQAGSGRPVTSYLGAPSTATALR
jgi:hypothetical protein